MEASPCQQRGDSDCAEGMGSPVQLPEDILHQIHALMPIRDAAQAACVSRGFLRSWRSYPNLIFCIDSLGIDDDALDEKEITRDFISRVDHIMRNHSGMGVKEFILDSYPCSNLDRSYVDRWLQAAITPGIKEIELSIFDFGDTKYSFPCSFLSSERVSSIQSLMLGGCSFHSAPQVCDMSSLRNLDLFSVDISGEELYCFLSNTCALDQLCLSYCDDIICVKIPGLLQQLNTLDVKNCKKLEMIDSNAPNLSTFSYAGHQVHISLGDASQLVRKARFCRDYLSGALYDASTVLPFIVPNLQTLILTTSDESVNTPPAFGKFLLLKYLEIVVSGPMFSTDYDFCSMVSFLDASPALETFILRIGMPSIRQDSIIEGDSSHLQCLPECCHENLKNVTITGFCSAKSMIKLVVHIMEKTKSLECLTLDTTRGHDRGYDKIDKCLPMCREALMEAEAAFVAIQKYIYQRVPLAVNLKIIEPCSDCAKK